jgi:hypothetical protein
LVTSLKDQAKQAFAFMEKRNPSPGGETRKRKRKKRRNKLLRELVEKGVTDPAILRLALSPVSSDESD